GGWWLFFFSSRRRHTRSKRDWSSDVCSSDLFVSDEEVDRVAAYMRTIAEPNYLFEQEQLLLDVEEEEEDELLHEVIHFVVSQNQASTSLLQRRFSIGYNGAARLIDTLEMKGIVAEQHGSKAGEGLISTAQL